jgi:cell division protein ZapA (FtsZ GTPase activity inhibitor)
MSSKRTIPVRILGQEYRVRTDAGDDLVHRAAGLVDETMRRIQGRTGTVDTRDLAVLTALNLANQVVTGRPDATFLPDARVGALADLVESTLAEESRAG